LRAEDQGPGEGGGNGASLPDPAYHRLGEIVRDRLAVGLEQTKGVVNSVGATSV